MSTVIPRAREDRPVADTAVARTSLFTPTRDRLLVLAWIAAGTLLVLEIHAALTTIWGADSYTYWSVWARPAMYFQPPEGHGAYLYSPVFAQLIYPLTLLPWPIFFAGWLVAGTATYVWLIRPIGWVWGVPLFVLAIEDLRIGNAAWLLLIAVVAGMRFGPPWAVPLLTKIGPGVGALWLVQRREWRQVAALAATMLGVVAVSFALAPDLWREWFTFLASHGGGTASVRLVLGGVVVWIAARRDWPWLVLAGLMLASPVFAIYVLGFACATPRLLSTDALAWARAPFGGFRATMRRALDLP